MYVHYEAPDNSNEAELAITFDRSEKAEYKAVLAGLPEAHWNPETQQWEVEVRAEVPRQRQQKSRRGKASRSRVRVHKRVLQSARTKKSVRSCR